MKRRARPISIAAATAGVLCLTASAAGGQAQEDVRVLVERASAYVAKYAAELKFVLAEERSVQRAHDARGRQLAERRIEGDIYLAYLPADNVWMAIHDVAAVDGRRVDDREDLHALLRQGAVSSVAARVASRNAAFNLGAITRNFNEPTLPLLLLTPKFAGRVRFRVAHADGNRATLSYQERDRPTLIHSRSGAPIESRGEFVIDRATGRVEATTLELSADGIRARLQTTYARNDTLDLWVPVAFEERYEGAPRGKPREIVTCEAAYSNYRRFEVVGRIK